MTASPRFAWWHRLLLVLLGLLVLFVAVVSLFLAYDSSQNYVQEYSWQPGGITEKRQELATQCEVRSYGSVVGCGSFYDATSLVDDLLANKTITPGMVTEPRTEQGDVMLLQNTEKVFNFRAYQQREFSVAKGWKAFGYALLAIFAALFLAALVFNLILWIAHGTTRLAP